MLDEFDLDGGGTIDFMEFMVIDARLNSLVFPIQIVF